MVLFTIKKSYLRDAKLFIFSDSIWPFLGLAINPDRFIFATKEIKYATSTKHFNLHSHITHELYKLKETKTVDKLWSGREASIKGAEANKATPRNQEHVLQAIADVM